VTADFFDAACSSVGSSLANRSRSAFSASPLRPTFAARLPTPNKLRQYSRWLSTIPRVVTRAEEGHTNGPRNHPTQPPSSVVEPGHTNGPRNHPTHLPQPQPSCAQSPGRPITLRSWSVEALETTRSAASGGCPWWFRRTDPSVPAQPTTNPKCQRYRLEWSHAQTGRANVAPEG